MKTQNNQLQLESKAQEEDPEAHSAALHILRPNLSATATISAFQPLVSHSDLPAMLDELDSQTRAIWSGNLGRPEEMLSGQAHALDGMFNALAQKAGQAMKSGNLPSMEGYLKMALRCQGQCRTTLEALGEFKAPKSTTFVRQQNVADQQQINHGITVNGAVAHPRAHEEITEGSSNKLNKLISGANHATVDTARTRSASRIDSHIQDMDTLHGPTNRSR